MEVPGGRNNKRHVFLVEVIGTAFIMMAVNWGNTTDATPMCVAGMLVILIQLFGDISGGHFNPAVTFCMLFKEGKEHWGGNIGLTIAMWICQGIGGFIGTAISAGGFSFEKQGDVKKVPDGGYHVA